MKQRPGSPTAALESASDVDREAKKAAVEKVIAQTSAAAKDYQSESSRAAREERQRARYQYD